MNVENLIRIIKNDGVIAYPTEAVFGLGCSAFSEKAVHRILKLKQRSVEKGLILIAADISQITPYIKADVKLLEKALNYWPGPYTLLFPINHNVPKFITGAHNKIAVRVTAHPIAKKLCEDVGEALVSTSANLAGAEPLLDYEDVKKVFGDDVDYVVPGEVNKNSKPSTIIDLQTDKILRS